MSRDLLAEHCTAPGCASGYVTLWVDGMKQITRCVVCVGTTRRIRGTHDPRSAIDFEEPTQLETSLRELVRKHPNDSDLGAALRALLNSPSP